MTNVDGLPEILLKRKAVVYAGQSRAINLICTPTYILHNKSYQFFCMCIFGMVAGDR